MIDFDLIRSVAQDYRVLHNRFSGVVLVFEGSAYGWKDKLRNPEHESVGSIAVDPEGFLFEAKGKGYNSGASCWVAM